MAKYLFIESRDPFEVADTGHVCELVQQLAQEGDEVTVYFVQNGVMAARAEARSESILKLVKSGKVKTLVDDYSLKERGIEEHELHGEMRVSNMESLVDLLMTDQMRSVCC